MKIKRNILLNPGPATTTDSVKMSQVVPDICPREKEFGILMESVTKDLTKIAGGDKGYTTILFGGSGTAAMDSVINSTVEPGKKILIINNGAYGERIIKIAKTYSVRFIELKFEWGTMPKLDAIEKELKKNKQIGYVAMVHHETTTGMLNPVKDVGKIAKNHNCVFIVDAMSSFAAIPFNIKDYQIDFMMSNSNKCIQGISGCCFIICKKEELEKIKDYPKKSFYLDLYNQYKHFKERHQMQFTPPVQVVYALRKAIDEFFKEGTKNRYKRYLKSWKTLVKGMESLGFKRLLKDEEESHILTTFIELEDPNYNFDKMHDLLYKKGFTIYPGKIGERDTFRIANMGSIDYTDIKNFLKALKSVVDEMNIKLK